jgi:HSP20 family protein
MKRNKNNDLYSALSLFDDFMNNFWHEDYNQNSKFMAIDVLEHEDSFEIQADLPGISKEDVKVSVKERVLKIETCVKKELKDEKRTFHRQERYTGCYQRTLTLPENCDQGNIKAKMEDGVLTLIIAKSSPKPNTLITIE